MQVYLPTPYPEELFLSSVSRYAQRLGLENLKPLSNALYGYERDTRPIDTDLPTSMIAVAERLSLAWGFSGKELVENHTLYPFYARYLDENRRSKCLESLLRGRSGNEYYPLAKRTRLGKSSLDNHLRLCRSCTESDMSVYGESYWRRVHQLPGVLVCPQHRTPLIMTTACKYTRKLHQHYDPISIISSSPIRYCLTRNSDIEKATKLAKRCQEILHDEVALWSPAELPDAYRKAAIERSLTHGTKLLDQKNICQAFMNYYGADFIRMLGMPASSHANSRWLSRMFGENVPTFPLYHALIQLFLESLRPKLNADVIFCAGPWKCPNPFASHTEAYPITKSMMEFYRNKDGNISANVTCSCGFCFTFDKVSEADPRLPQVSRVSRYGPAIIDKVQLLQQHGLSWNEIRLRLGIRSNLRLKSQFDGPTPEKIGLWRQIWLRALDNNTTWSKAYRQCRQIYGRLRKYDVAWLQQISKERAFPKKQMTQRIQKSVDWAARDTVWSDRLKAAALTLLETRPAIRVTQRAIIVEAELGKIEGFNRLPKCRETIGRYRETMGEFNLRKSLGHESGLPIKRK